MKIAVLMTSFNRKEITLNSLNSLFESIIPEEIILDIFLLDDDSTDGTVSTIKKYHPIVNIFIGTGSLYWGQGMRLIWKNAVIKDEYDFYLWLNDDTIIYNYGLNEMIKLHQTFSDESQNIICGTLEQFNGSNVFSYGLRNSNNEPIIPNGKKENLSGYLMNGNLVLISNEIFRELGFISEKYTHQFGDIEYGLRAIKKNINIITPNKFVGSCPSNKQPQKCFDTQYSVFERLKFLKDPKGLMLFEFLDFKKTYFNERYIGNILKIITKTIFPKTYNIVKSIWN